MLLNQEILQESCVFKGKTNTWLHIQFDEDISEELGNSLPYPHQHYLRNNKLVYCWLIDGYFDTIDGYNYLNDIIARFKISFVDCKYLQHTKDGESKLKPLKLKQFQGLKSRANQIIKEKYQRAETHQDYVWWCIKLYCEDLIKKEGLIIYDSLERWAFENFVDKCKDNSTLRAKCRSTYNWYFDRNWKVGRANKKYDSLKDYWEETMASRKEHMIQVNKNKAEEAKRKIINCMTGIFNTDYKKKNGKWNAIKLAEATGLSDKTVRKHLKDITNE